MPTTVTAKPGDTLCGLAIDAGFLDCKPIRDFAANQGKAFLNRQLVPGDLIEIPDLEQKLIDKAIELLHTFFKKSAPPVSIRFVHGSQSLPFRKDATSTFLNISNFPSDKAGKNLKQALPTATKFDPLGHDDEDSFKLEVVDPAGPAKVEVLLEALRPVFAPDGSILRHEPFAGNEHDRRSLKVQAELVKSKVCYRSPYLRLVVDDPDQAANSKQTLLITDLTDGKDDDNDRLEILDQQVRASYTRPTCPAGDKCTVTTTLPIGSNRKRVKLRVHILKDPANGNALSNEEQVRRTLLMYLRQVYAQVEMSMKLVAKSREIVAPANMLVVDNIEGRRAAGGGQVTVRVKIGADFNQTATITTIKNATCAETASALATAIRGIVPADVMVRDLPNPPIFGKTRGSADIIVGDPLQKDVRVSVETSGDAKQLVVAAALVSAVFDTGSGNERHVGNINSRLLLNNYDTGREHLDVFIVGNLPGLLGLAFNPFRKYVKSYGHPPARDEIANSFLVNNTTLHTPGQAENFYTTIPHEIGHVLIDAIHSTPSRPTELIGPGSPVGKNERVVNGPKRITADQSISFDEGVRDVPATMFRENNTEILDGF